MPFRLLDLPPELWSHICALALASDYPSTLYLHEDSHARTLQSLTQQPPLLRTCTALRTEGIALWYANTVFLLIEANKSSPNWRLWLESLTPHTPRYMRKLFITSTHQDLVAHVQKNELLPRGCELSFAESLGQDSFRLCDFTYKITLPACDEASPRVDAVQELSGDCTENGRVGRSSKKVNSIWGQVLPSTWQTRRSGAARSRWLRAVCMAALCSPAGSYEVC